MVHGRSIVSPTNPEDRRAMSRTRNQMDFDSSECYRYRQEEGAIREISANSQYMWCLKALDISTLWPNGNTHGSHRRNLTSVW